MTAVDRDKQSGFRAVAEWVRELDVSAWGGDRFVGAASREEGRLFGGLVIAQGAIAAGRTVDSDRNIHSLHAYFLRPGKPRVPVEYHAERVRDGRSFTARRVLALQAGEAICDMTVSFARPEEGISHQGTMPVVPPPEEARDAADFWRERHPENTHEHEEHEHQWPFDVRYITPPDIAAAPGEPLHAYEWARLRSPMPDDPVIHSAGLIYWSDMGSFAGIERRYGWEGMVGNASASLDHAIWVHHPVKWDDWMLVCTNTPVAHSARALTLREFYARDGTHVATMAQEAVFRQRKK
jgi:acyl-CoA thioesterase-2